MLFKKISIRQDVTSMVTTKPVIEGWTVGRSVVGVELGATDGIAVGTDVINTDSLATSHSAFVTSSNASIDAFTSSTFVASIVS